MLFAENSENFSFEDCNFAVQKSRESTARIVMWREFNLINSFTLECSFCGPTKGMYTGCHFNPTILEIMGAVFCKTLVDYIDNEVRVKQIYQDLQLRYPVNGQKNDDKEDSSKY